MEQKLRKCEQAGVEASVDIQLAARRVAEENERLREENGRLREEGKRLRGEMEKMRTIVEGNRPGMVGASIGGEHVAELSSHEIEDVEPEAKSQLQGSVDRQMEENTTTTGNEGIYADLTPTRPEQSPEVSYIGRNDQMVLGDDTSSCEYAAHIITSMRADITTDDVRADLGCGGDVREWRKCKVDNSKLFVAMDRYTG